MPRSRYLIPLSHDHHHALKLAQMLRKNAPQMESTPESPFEKARRALEFYESDLVVHFAEEEKILYPFVRGRSKDVDELFKEIFSEHKLIKELVEGLSKEETGLEEKLDLLGKLLESHIRKEERELFPKIQAVFSEEELSKLNGKIKAVR